jgi:hypothetical protein
MFHGSGGWGALQLVGKYDVLDQSDTAFNNAGGCRLIRLYPGLSSTGEAPNATLAANQITPLRGVTYRFEKGLKLERHMRPHLLPAYYTCLRTRKKMGAF